jgi:hypothetical protein
MKQGDTKSLTATVTKRVFDRTIAHGIKRGTVTFDDISGYGIPWEIITNMVQGEAMYDVASDAFEDVPENAPTGVIIDFVYDEGDMSVGIAAGWDVAEVTILS